ncbi:uncharacterized protein ACA1_319530 [Acanthamoeba castellanii str. Neff]|uniref:Uncharacterized protein n=1 Tax=Acanthamoeba castellanii (strain ATCC 30010 / Neff) TaxID=1257118 RepID=L8HLY2_ACACF|nr:uncharacterized protein ACA1_319530 [Acanthamoeba castellanii str. Neff]ELR25663.1 hypothetical protein ACA1_319530 [Acanthamoeba castellanii str. Neff]
MRAWQWLLLTTGLFFIVWYFTWPSAGVETKVATTHDSREEHSSQDAPSLQQPSSLSPAGEIPVVSITFGECKGDYLSVALKELTKRNGNVVVLGDSESCALLARQTGTKFISRKPYSKEGDAFREVLANTTAVIVFKASFAHVEPEKRPCWGFQAVEGSEECAEVWERLCNPKVLDKARERNRRPKYTPGSLALPRHGMMWDNNLDMDDEWGLFATVPGSTYKQIEWRDGDQPFYIFNEQANVGQSFGRAEGLPEPAVLAGLHFQGGKKSMLPSYTTWDTEWNRRCRCSTPDCRNCVVSSSTRSS